MGFKAAEEAAFPVVTGNSTGLSQHPTLVPIFSKSSAAVVKSNQDDR